MAASPFRFSWNLGALPETGYAEATLDVVKRLARADSKTPEIRLLAQELTREVLPYDQRSEAEALRQFVRDDIRYTRDIAGVETVQSPRFTLRVGSGDCDDKSALLGALLLSIGFPVRYVLTATNPAAPANFTHIYPEAFIRGRGWMPLETIIPGAPEGYRVRSFRRKVIA